MAYPLPEPAEEYEVDPEVLQAAFDRLTAEHGDEVYVEGDVENTYDLTGFRLGQARVTRKADGVKGTLETQTVQHTMFYFHFTPRSF